MCRNRAAACACCCSNIRIFNCSYRLLSLIFVCRSTADFRIGYSSAHRRCAGCAYRADNGKNVRIVQGVCTYSFSVINGCAINNSAACAVRLRYGNIAAYSSSTARAYTCCNIIAVAAVFCIGAYGNAFGFFLVTFIKCCTGNICFGAVIKPDVAQRCTNTSFACTGNLPGNRNNLSSIGSFCRSLLCLYGRINNINICSVFYIIPCYTANAASLTCRCNATGYSNNIAVTACFGVKFFSSNIGIFNICRIVIFNIRNSNSRPTGTFADCSCKAARNGNNTAAAIFIYIDAFIFTKLIGSIAHINTLNVFAFAASNFFAAGNIKIAAHALSNFRFTICKLIGKCFFVNTVVINGNILRRYVHAAAINGSNYNFIITAVAFNKSIGSIMHFIVNSSAFNYCASTITAGRNSCACRNANGNIFKRVHCVYINIANIGIAAAFNACIDVIIKLSYGNCRPYTNLLLPST